MFESLATALAAGLSIWAHKEKHKYVDRLMDLRKRHYEEYNKLDDYRSDAVLDNLEFELRVLASAFSTAVGEKNPAA